MKFIRFRKRFPSAAICALALVLGVSSSLAIPIWAQDPPQQEAPPPPPQDQTQEQAPPPQDQAQQETPPLPAQNEPQTAPLSPKQLQELVSPIALYPDALVAQILAASAYPTQIVEVERFLQQNPNLKGKELGDAVNQQDWDPSVKALTQFPSVLANLDRDLSWTSELGDANYNQQADVMAAVQVMRRKAEEAGHLQTTPQQTVANQGTNVVIQPANPEVVYVPEYNPCLLYTSRCV